jgi:hypothetical protein
MTICFIFLRVLRCFTSPGVALKPYFIRTPVSRHDSGWVAPFGNPRIKVCLPLPGAYRSLPRPSSPADAKASIVRPYMLDQIKLVFFLILLRRLPAPRKTEQTVELLALLSLCNCQRTNPLSREIVSQPRFHGDWWACLESNQGPRPYQGRALTN